MMAARICDVAGAEALQRLIDLCLQHDLPGHPQEAVATLSTTAPALFDLARVALTYAYYETPAVIAVLRRLGFDYNDAPQPKGYAMRPFDPSIDSPKERRGHYVATSDVQRVDMSGLDFLKGGEA